MKDWPNLTVFKIVRTFPISYHGNMIYNTSGSTEQSKEFTLSNYQKIFLENILKITMIYSLFAKKPL